MFNGAAPDFALEGGFPLALVRGLADAAMISAFGALLFRGLILPRDADVPVRRAIVRLVRASACGGAVLMLAWLALEARAMSGGEVLGAMPAVLMRTDFGHLIAAQFVLLLLTAIVPTRFAILPALAALAAQAGHSHAYSMSGTESLLFGSDLLHLIAAGAWLGALLPLLLTIRLAPRQAVTAARRFSPLGIAAVAVLAATALFQGSVLVDTPAGADRHRLRLGRAVQDRAFRLADPVRGVEPDALHACPRGGRAGDAGAERRDRDRARPCYRRRGGDAQRP